MQKVPIVYPVFQVPIVLYNFAKEFTQKVIIRRFLESKFSNVIEVNAKFF